jgi:DNA-binding NarL/FixJ family response regulator
MGAIHAAGQRPQRLWEDVGDRYQAAYARFRRAEALIASESSRREAEALCREARAVAVELGARPLERELNALARRARLDLKGVPEAGAGAAPLERFELTPRELDVLPLIADGRTNREIAAELFISDKTASVHVSRILAKLGVCNRAEAAAVAHRLGAVTPADPDAAGVDGT